MALAFCPDRESSGFSGRPGAGTRTGTRAAFGLFFLVGLVLCAPVFVCAAERSESVSSTSIHAARAEADTLIVSARALADPVAPSAAGLVSVLELDDESGPIDLAEALGRTAGFQIRRTGGLGFAAVPSLRGSAAAQIRILIDGLPLNEAQSGTIDLSALPADRFARAEIHRGVVPGGLGGMGGAGAVNLITRPHADGLEATAFAGGFGSAGGRVTWGASDILNDTGSLLLMAHARRADNDYEYTDNRQTFDTAGDDTTRTRENSWFEEFGLWSKSRIAVHGVETEIAAGCFRKDGGRPGPISYPSPHASVRLERCDGRLALRLPLAIAAELAAARQKEWLYDPESEIEDGFGGTIRSLGTDVTQRLTWSPRLAGEPARAGVFTQADLVCGVDRRRQWYRQWYGPDEDPHRSRMTDSAFASLAAQFLTGRLQLVPAWRWQRNEDDFPPLPPLPWLPEEEGISHVRYDVSPSVGLVWRLTPETWTLEAHAGESMRVPTWVELFGHRGGIDGNRELQPEEITAADVAVTWKPAAKSYLRLAAFLAETDRTIVFLQNSAATSKARNIGATRNRGVEIEGAAALPARLSLTGNLTAQHPQDRGDQPQYHGNDLPYLARVEGDLRLARSLRRGAVWIEAAFQGRRYRDRAGTDLIRAGDRWLWNLGARHVWRDRYELTAEVINLGDDRTYDIVQFPLPGRTWQLALRVTR